ncbi:MAG: ABC transporter ATP-binding protein [Chlamydiae bacterium]|nr:ABC transporter ATP-binding protein [Chlamydiota bacterium]MBI3265584.1 ABC transporter ATP-binding protein [Chlamydiota bacterium]
MNWQDPDDSGPENRLRLKVFELFTKRLWPYITKYRKLFIVSLSLVFFTTGASLSIPWLLGKAVDLALLPKKAALLLPFGFILLTLDALNALATYFQNLSFTKLGQEVIHDLRQDLLKQYQFYPLHEFNQNPIGRLVTRLVNDTSSLQDLFTSGLAVTLGNICVVAGIIVWLMVLHPSLGLICVSVFPIMAFFSRFFGRRIRETARDSRQALSQLNATLAENISGMSLIQIFNRQKTFHDLFDRTSKDYTRTQIKTLESFAYFQPTITFLSSLSMLLLIWYGGFLSLKNSISLGMLVSFMAYLHSLYSPIRDITEKYNLFLTAMTSCERIFEFLDRPLEKQIRPQETQIEKLSLQGSIEFQNVSFRYSQEKESLWVLVNLNFCIEAGEKIGIVGYTGAGKTTLVHLLMQFYDLEQGEILIDGKNISETSDKRMLRQKIGYIQQEPFLFSGTVEENIFLWDEKGREIFQALPDFARAPFESGPLFLKKEIFEKGANLSSGERQMIAFIRTLVQNPSILILDEATAHMDSLTEKWIERISKEAFQNRTVFIIAHRLATLKSVSRILVLHHGELVEMGTHSTLLSKKGIYAKLYQLQSRKEALEGTPRI